MSDEKEQAVADRKRELAERKKTYREAKKAAGICIQCSEPAEPGRTRCAKHVAAQRVEMVRQRDAWKSQGLCQKCGGEPLPGKATCATCGKQSVDAAGSRYQRNKIKGVCRSCGRDTGGQSLCDICKAVTKRGQKARYERLKAAGICVQCADKPAATGCVSCTECKTKQSDWQRDHGAAIKREVMDAYGGPVCVGCGYADITVLEIDHINGGGTQHLKKIGKGKLYPWLKANNYPEGFRVLCPTCNKTAARGRPLPNEQPKPNETS